MADQHPSEDPNPNNNCRGGSESSVEINIRTLDSQNHAFHVDKNIQVSALKEKVAAQIGVPVAHQRLIFRGKLLKDDHLLSEYHLENGDDALHLVVREPSQSQPPSGSGTAEATSTNGQRPHNLIGQISLGVILGSLNLGHQGDGLVSDLSRVIGTLLNSIGIGNQIVGQPTGVQVTTPNIASQVNEAEGIPNNSGTQNQDENQLPSQSLPQVMQIPLSATNPTMPIPSLNMIEFINRMEFVLSQSGNQQNQMPAGSSSVELPRNARGLPTSLALSSVLRRTEHLISNHVVSGLSHIGGRLEQESDSTDLTVRGQIQREAVQLGLAMHQLGAMFLELGRTILTLRIGQSPADSVVNSGPAVYISPSGANPILVQPFPLQTNSLFSGFSSAPSIPGGFIPIGIGSAPRNVNIHIHSVGARSTNGNVAPQERANRNGSGNSNQTGNVPERNSVATDVPPTATVTSVSGAPQPGLPENATSEEPPISFGRESQRTDESQKMRVSSPQISEGTSSVSAGGSQGIDAPGSSSPVPLGLGMGGLQPKKKTRPSKPQVKNANCDATPSANSTQETLESTNSCRNSEPDLVNVISQVLQNPAMDDLLRGVSQQTGVGSPDFFRNMLQQFTQSPAMMNTVSQIAQQIDTQDLGSVFSGLGFDFSSMLQQVMPLVSQALGGVSTTAQQPPQTQVRPNEGDAGRETMPPAENSQSGLQAVARRVECRSSPEDIFRGVVESAACLYTGRSDESLVNDLCSTEGLASEFMEVLHHDISQRLQDETKSAGKS